MRNTTIRDARPGSSNAAGPAKAKSATHSFNRAFTSGRHKNFPAFSGFSAEMLRFVSSTSRAPRYTSQQTSNTISGLTLIAPPATNRHALHNSCHSESAAADEESAFVLLALTVSTPLVHPLVHSFHHASLVPPNIAHRSERRRLFRFSRYSQTTPCAFPE